MKISAFQAILYGVFGVSALIGLFVFATYTAKNGANAIGPVVIWGTLPKESMEATLIELNKIEVSLKNVSYVEKDPRALPADLAAQTDYNPELLKVKTCFAEREIRSLNEPLVGFATHHQ